MSIIRYAPLIAALGSVTAFAADPTISELQQEVKSLRQEVQELKAQRTSSADVDALVRQVLEDSQRRSQIAPVDGITAAYNDGHFVIRSADGAFSISPILLFQFRYEMSYREEVPQQTGSGSSFDDNFDIRRAQFGFEGTAVTPDMSYKFVWEAVNHTVTTTNNDGQLITSNVPTTELLDAWVRYRFAREWSVFGGQFQDLLSHESLVRAEHQLAAELSLADQLLTGGTDNYVDGVGVGYESKHWRAEAAFHNGLASANAPILQLTNSGPFWGASARAEFMLAGDNWKQYDDMTAMDKHGDLLVAGIDADYTEGSMARRIPYGADVQWEPKVVPGLAIYASLMGFYEDFNNSPDMSDWGFVVQAGYMLTRRWEIFARYDETFLGALSSGGFVVRDSERIPEATIGTNYYIKGQTAKFTIDLTWLPQGTQGMSFPNAGILPTQGNADELVARLQFQLFL